MGMENNNFSKGAHAVATRIVNAEERFISYAMEVANISRDEALKALATYRKVKAIKIDAVGGEFRFTHGGFAEADVILRAVAA